MSSRNISHQSSCSCPGAGTVSESIEPKLGKNTGVVKHSALKGESTVAAAMSSRTQINGTPRNFLLARTGDGAFFQNGLSKGMAVSPNPHHPDGEHAIRMLSTQLHLTPRQAEVLHWIAKGKTNEEIATILGCSFFTVKTHIKEIFQRLGVPNRAAAIAAAYSMFYELLRQTSASPERGIPEKAVAR